MEIILTQDVNNLGHKDEIVKVKNGYGRNYLIPQGMGQLATESNRKVLAETLRQRAHKEEKIRTEATAMALNGETRRSRRRVYHHLSLGLPRSLSRSLALTPTHSHTCIHKHTYSTTIPHHTRLVCFQQTKLLYQNSKT